MIRIEAIWLAKIPVDLRAGTDPRCHHHRAPLSVSFRFAASLLAAQAALPSSFAAWTHPVFAVVAGDDKLANAQGAKALLDTIPKALMEYHACPENFHENFNELNRNTIFADILNWMGQRIAI